MQLDQFYLSIIQISLIDAISLGAGAGLLVCTYIGIMIKRGEFGGFSWVLGGTGAVVIGTSIGWFVMTTTGFIVEWSGSAIQGLTGADLVEWTDTIASTFPYFQMHAAGFAMMGSLLGIGLGYGIASHPDDTSLLGNLIAILGVAVIVTGLMCMLLPSFITLADADAFLYLVMINGVIVLGYGIRSLVNQMRGDSTSEHAQSAADELIV